MKCLYRCKQVLLRSTVRLRCRCGRSFRPVGIRARTCRRRWIRCGRRWSCCRDPWRGVKWRPAVCPSCWCWARPHPAVPEWSSGSHGSAEGFRTICLLRCSGGCRCFRRPIPAGSAGCSCRWPRCPGGWCRWCTPPHRSRWKEVDRSPRLKVAKNIERNVRLEHPPDTYRHRAAPDWTKFAPEGTCSSSGRSADDRPGSGSWWSSGRWNRIRSPIRRTEAKARRTGSTCRWAAPLTKCRPLDRRDAIGPAARSPGRRRTSPSNRRWSTSWAARLDRVPGLEQGRSPRRGRWAGRMTTDRPVRSAASCCRPIGGRVRTCTPPCRPLSGRWPSTSPARTPEGRRNVRLHVREKKFRVISFFWKARRNANAIYRQILSNFVFFVLRLFLSLSCELTLVDLRYAKSLRREMHKIRINQ